MSIKKYRKEPVVVEAIRLTPETFGDIVPWIGKDVFVKARAINPVYIVISTLEGNMRANNGDYIIKGVYGEFYPCKPDIFEKTYEAEEE